MWASSCGRPSPERIQVAPPSLVRQTAAAPPGIMRPCSGSVSGMVQTVIGSRGWAAITNPKSDGSPSVISSQAAPPSVER